MDDWDNKPGLKEAISALKPGPWKTELPSANILFSEKYLERAKKTGAPSTENIGSKRNEANEAWYTLRDLINGYYTIQKCAAPCGPTVSFINSGRIIVYMVMPTL